MAPNCVYQSDITSKVSSEFPSELPSDGPTAQGVGCDGNFSDGTALDAGVQLFLANCTSAIALPGNIGSWCTSLVKTVHNFFQEVKNFKQDLTS